MLTVKLVTGLNIRVMSMSPQVVESARIGIVRIPTSMDLVGLEHTISVGILMGNPMHGVTPWMTRDGNFVISRHAMSVTKINSHTITHGLKYIKCAVKNVTFYKLQSQDLELKILVLSNKKEQYYRSGNWHTDLTHNINIWGQMTFTHASFVLVTIVTISKPSLS